MSNGEEMGAGVSSVASAEGGDSVSGSVSPVLGTEVQLVQAAPAPEAGDVEGGPGPDHYTQNPGYQESFVA